MNSFQPPEPLTHDTTRADMRNVLQSWVKHPERHLRGATEQQKASFEANLISALAFYSEEQHHETYEQAKSSRTFR